ncbi:MAG: Holliday junction resolvase RuvX [Christensenellales bacterium]
MRIMGIDYGEKRIGIACSDALRITAQGIETYARKTEQEDIEYLLQLAGTMDVEKIVFGMPRNMNGTYGPAAEKVKEFAGRLSQKTDVPVVYWDERLSTVSAHKTMLEANVSRKKRKLAVDKLAAVMFLQNYLDATGSY